MNIYLCWGWFCSLITFIITIILSNILEMKELNPILNLFLFNTYYAILFYGIAWSLIFTIYHYYRYNQLYSNYISYSCCFIFTFNLIHDIISIYGGSII